MRWNEMQPRSRDAWLAERAGDWENVRVAPSGQLFGEINAPYRHSAEVPYYTTDSAAALALAEAMRGKGYYVFVELRPDRSAEEMDDEPKERYCCEIHPLDAGVQECYADTFAGAVSLAAFRALRGEE